MTKEWLDQVAASALCHRETLEATYDITTSLISRGIPGDFVECGVFAGAHCAVMARAIMEDLPNYSDLVAPSFRRENPNRRVHLFDSFTGIPQAGPNDIEFIEAGKKPGESTCSRAQVEAYMDAWGIRSELLVYHEGLFSETIPRFIYEEDMHRIDATPIALLRLDGDLYDSTKDCMPLLHHVSRGGWVCVDDFNLSGCRQALLEQLVPAPIYWRMPCK